MYFVKSYLSINSEQNSKLVTQDIYVYTLTKTHKYNQGEGSYQDLDKSRRAVKGSEGTNHFETKTETILATD